MMKNRLLAVLLVGLLASGCSGEKAGGGAASTAKATAAKGADAVAAVLQTEGAPVARLAFVVVTRPVVGAQSELRLDLSSAAAVPSLEVRTEAASITIDPSSAVATVSLEAGNTLSHQVRLTPQREGLAEITVRLRAGPNGAETVYVIPVLVAATAAAAAGA